MYIVRVLTGESTPSRSGMKYLPNKPGTNIPYDSGTAGNIFIIFHDTQAYPEYLITFWNAVIMEGNIVGKRLEDASL